MRFNYAVEATKQLLSNSYRNVLIEDEIDQHTSATFEANREHLKLQVDGYRRLWYSVSSVLLLTFAIGYVANYGIPYGDVQKPIADSPLSNHQAPTSVLPSKRDNAEHSRGAMTSPPKTTPDPVEPKRDDNNVLNKAK